MVGALSAPEADGAVRSSMKGSWPRDPVSHPYTRALITSACSMRTFSVNGAASLLSYSSCLNRLCHARASRIRRFVSGTMLAHASTRPPRYQHGVACRRIPLAWCSMTSGEIVPGAVSSAAWSRYIFRRRKTCCLENVHNGTHHFLRATPSSLAYGKPLTAPVTHDKCSTLTPRRLLEVS